MISFAGTSSFTGYFTVFRSFDSSFLVWPEPGSVLAPVCRHDILYLIVVLLKEFLHVMAVVELKPCVNECFYMASGDVETKTDLFAA